MFAHGGGYEASGAEGSLTWFSHQMGNIYERNAQTVGPGKNDENTGTVFHQFAISQDGGDHSTFTCDADQVNIERHIASIGAFYPGGAARGPSKIAAGEGMTSLEANAPGDWTSGDVGGVGAACPGFPGGTCPSLVTQSHANGDGDAGVNHFTSMTAKRVYPYMSRAKSSHSGGGMNRANHRSMTDERQIIVHSI